jgi:hypothetical protein
VALAIEGRLVALAERIEPSTPRPPAADEGELETAVRRLTERHLSGAVRSEAESYDRLMGLLHDLDRSLAPLSTT